MQDFVERMIEEKENLLEKIDKLFIFLGSKKFEELSEQNKVLLTQQYFAMSKYYNILSIRIKINK